MTPRGNVNDFINYLTQQRRNPMIDSLRPFLSRIIAPLVTALLTYLAVHFGLNFGEDAAGHITETAVIAVIAGMQIVYGLVHRVVDKKVNPGDTASSHLAVEAKAAAEEAKA